MRVISDDERRGRIAARHAVAPGSQVTSVAASVAAMTCLHATEAANVYLSAFARTGAARTAIDHALYEERSIVRQLAMRRTVFAAPRDLMPAIRGSAAARVATQLSARLVKEVTAGGIASDGAAWLHDTSTAVLMRLRQAPATTAQLREELPALAERLQLSPGTAYAADVPIASRLLGALAATGAVVRGHNDGGWKVSRPYWTVVEDWLGAGEPPATSAREGYAELVDRWLWTFGPGTEEDIVWWLGATKSAVRRALADVDAQTVTLEDGRPAWLHREDVDPVAPTSAWAALLPALDPTTMGWKERDFYLGPHREMVFDRNGNGGPTAWWDGRIVGGWGQTPDGSVVIVPTADGLPRGAAGPLQEAAAALTRWLDGDVVRSIYQSPLVRAWQG